ncbi:MAG: serine/threonine-protein kinase [Nanoarchaeota archaeon]
MSLDKTILDSDFRNENNIGGSDKKFYHIEKHELIGSGAGSEVWKGYRITPYDYEEVVIKVSNRDSDCLTSLKKEARLAKSLKEHDGIGKIIAYDFDEKLKKGQILMEYIDGKNIAEIVAWHKKNLLNLHFPQRLAAFIGFECSKSLDYAHKKIISDENGKSSIGLIHRDITPQNIIITHTGYPKIIDFGLGILSSDVGRKDVIGKVAGKLGFIAPEIFNNKLIDFSVDIYSLGMVMDYLIRGRNPLLDDIKENSDSFEAINKTIENINKGFKKINEEIGHVDDVLSSIISKATEKDSGKRYGTMEELHNDIKNYLYVNGPTRLGPTREALKSYIELIYTPGLETNVLLSSENKNYYLHDELKRKIKQIMEQAPYMVREGNFCLETISNDKNGYISINLQS